MDKWIGGLLLLVSFQSFAQSNSFSFKESAQLRNSETWQFMGNFGIGYGSITGSGQPLADFAAMSGSGLPLSVSAAIYHPRGNGERLHFGYSIDAAAYTKSQGLLFFENGETQFSRLTLGVGFLLYLTPERQSYWRSSVGLSGSTLETRETWMDKETIRSRVQYSNGWGLTTEIGSVFQNSGFELDLFTYSLQLGYGRAFHPSLGVVSSASISAQIGILL